MAQFVYLSSYSLVLLGEEEESKMKLDENIWNYLMIVHSSYWLISDLAYFRSEKMGELKREDAGNGVKKHLHFRSLVKEIYPDYMLNAEGKYMLDGTTGLTGGDVSAFINHTICNNAPRNKTSIKLYNYIRYEKNYIALKEKINNQIKKWFSDDEYIKYILDEVIFGIFLQPKVLFGKNGTNLHLSYSTKGIMDIIDYNISEKKIEISDVTIKRINNVDEEKFNELKYEKLTHISNPNDRIKPHYALRGSINGLMEQGLFTEYSTETDGLKYVGKKSKHVIGRSLLSRRVKRMRNIDPLETFSSIIIFSIFLPYIVNEDGTGTVRVKDENIPLLYKLFYESTTAQIDDYDGSEKNAVQLAIDDIIDGYMFGDLKIVKRRLKQITEWNGDFLTKNSEFCFLNGILYELNEDFVSELGYCRDNLLKDVYDYCSNNKLDRIKNSEWSLYYANALLKYARQIFERKEGNYKCLNDILDKAKVIGGETADYNFIKADILRIGIDEIKAFNQNPCEAYELYIKVFAATNQESMVDDCIVPCLHEWAEWAKKNEKDDTLMGKKPEEWEKIWSNVKVDRGDNKSIYEKFIEKCRKDLKDKIEKIEALYNIKDVGIDLQTKNDSDLQTVSVPDNAEDIYIIIGAGKASRTFIHSVRYKEKCRVLLVPQEHEIGIIQSLKEWYKGSNVEVFTTGISTVLNSLDLYKIMSECENDKDVFEKYYASGVKKLHFMAIDEENKEGNLAAIVEVINQSWIRYYLYNLMAYSCTGVKFDFSEVDITIDSQAQTAWYLDSVMNRFGEDFYLKINHISPAELAVRELLTEYPLFLADVNDLRKYKGKSQETGHHDVVILGSNGVIVPTLIKSILQISGYMRDDKVTHEDLENAAQHYYKAFESAIGKDFSLTVIDEHAEGIEDIIVYDAPDLLREELDCVHTVPRFCNVNVHSSKFIRLLTQFKDNIKEKDTDKKKELEQVYKAIHNANYIIVATDDTEKSIDLAMKIRALRYRKDINDEPIISVYTPDSNQDEKINQFTIGKDVYEDAWHRSYHINMFGKCQEMYSEENLFNSIFDLISIELHLDDDFRKAQKKKRDYYKVVYNHRSCDSRATALIYVMYSVLGTKMIEDFTLSDTPKIASAANRWSMRIFKDSLSQYLSKYNEIVESKDKGLQGWIDILAALEHNRWNYMVMSEGYTGMPTNGQSDIDIKNKIKSWAARATDDEGAKDNDGRIEKTALKDNKLHMVKVHYAILPFDQLGDRIGLESIHYLNKEFSKIDELVREKKIKDYLAKNELIRLKESLKTEEEYTKILENAEDFVTLEKTEFDKKMGFNNQKTVGIDKFERLMDEIGIEIKGFKTTKNRHYDREYVRDMARTMERILSNVRGKQKSNNMPVNTRDNVQTNGKPTISKSLETRM